MPRPGRGRESGHRDGPGCRPLSLPGEGGLLSGRCECEWLSWNALRMGPCKHILALKVLDGRGEAS